MNADQNPAAPQKTQSPEAPTALSPTALSPTAWMRALRGTLVYLLLVACVIAVTWPWCRGFSTVLLSHWDPPFHTWKLWYVADAIRHGYILPPGMNTNMYYPYTGALYYEALHWPQALLAAILFSFTGNTVLVYHLVMVAFWALAGVCLWALLRELRLPQHAALLGAVLFTVIPYRTSYIVEFNMQFCFGIPLLLLFIVRYFRRPNVCDAALAALALCLQASSELYQAVFCLYVLPFIAIAFLAGRWKLLASPRSFLAPMAAAAAVGLAFTAAILYPYIIELGTSTVSRDLAEVIKHSLSVTSWLPCTNFNRFHVIPKLYRRADEFAAYPGIALLILTAIWLCARMRVNMTRAKWPEKTIRIVRAAAFMLFLALFFMPPPSCFAKGLSRVYTALPVIAVACSAALLFTLSKASQKDRFREALVAMCCFSFFMALGPFFLTSFSPNALLKNHVYLTLYKHGTALHGFRVISRFAIFVELMFCFAAVDLLGMSVCAIRGRIAKKRARAICLGAVAALATLAIALTFIEALPRPLRTRRVDASKQLPVLEYLDRQNEPCSIMMIPSGNRYYDSMNMLQIAGTSRLFIFAWGGTYPPFTTRAKLAVRNIADDPGEVLQTLGCVWPECKLLVDRRNIVLYGDKANAVEPALKQIADLEFGDDSYTLWKLRTQPAATSAFRFVRSDFIRGGERVSAFIRPADGEATAVRVSLNGAELTASPIQIPAEGANISVPYDKRLAERLDKNTILFSSEAPVTVSDFAIIAKP